jgi:hypothetical protein
MGQREKFDYGDAVRVIKGDHTGRVGAIVGIKDSSSDFTIEFGDGTDAQCPARNWRNFPIEVAQNPVSRAVAGPTFLLRAVKSCVHAGYESSGRLGRGVGRGRYSENDRGPFIPTGRVNRVWRNP